MMKLPHSEFRWLTREELESLDIENFESDGDFGIILEVRTD